MHDETRNPYLRANSMDELLSWNDVDFVRCAYVTVLGRRPDPTGEAHFARLIRSGTSKLDVLWRLRKSVEGPLHDPGIAGLDRALKRAARQRKPIWGAVARLFRPAADGNSRTDRALRVLNNIMSVNQQYLGAIDQKLAAIGMSGSTAPQPFPAPAISHPSAEAIAVDSMDVQVALHLPELNHLRNQAPLARYFQDNVS